MITKENTLVLMGAIARGNDFARDIQKMFGEPNDNPIDEIVSDMATVLFDLLELNDQDNLMSDDYYDTIFRLSIASDIEQIYKDLSVYFPEE